MSSETAKAHMAALCDKEEYPKTKTNFKLKLEDSQNQLSREQRRRHDAVQQIHHEELQLEQVKNRLTLREQQKTDAEIQSLKLVQNNQDQKSQISELEPKVFNSGSKMPDKELEIKSLTFQRNEIFYFDSKAMDYAFEQRERYKAVKAAYSVTMNIFRKKIIFFLNHL